MIFRVYPTINGKSQLKRLLPLLLLMPVTKLIVAKPSLSLPSPPFSLQTILKTYKKDKTSLSSSPQLNRDLYLWNLIRLSGGNVRYDNDGLDSKNSWREFTKYKTIGMINLMKKPQHLSTQSQPRQEESFATPQKYLSSWLHRHIITTDVDEEIAGNIRREDFAICNYNDDDKANENEVRNKMTMMGIGTFQLSNDEASAGDICETIGCFSDRVIILIGKNSKIEDLRQFVKGVERQRQQDVGCGKISIHVLLVETNDENDAFTVDDIRENVLVLKTLLNDDGGNEGGKIVAPSLSLSVLPVSSPKNNDDEMNETFINRLMHDIWGSSDNHDGKNNVNGEETGEKDIPLGIFSLYVERIYECIHRNVDDGNQSDGFTFVPVVEHQSLDSQRNLLPDKSNAVDNNEDSSIIHSTATSVEISNTESSDAEDSILVTDSDVGDNDDLDTYFPRQNDNIREQQPKTSDDSTELLSKVDDNELTKNPLTGQPRKESEIISTSTTGVSTASVTATAISKRLRGKISQVMEETTHFAETEMLALELKQDEIMLHPESKMPILEFGRDAEAILERINTSFDKLQVGESNKDLKLLFMDKVNSEFLEAKRKEILSKIAGNLGIRRLYHQQLQSLREYYGRRYESILDELTTDSIDDSDSDGIDMAERKKKRAEKNAILTEAAARATEGFRAAAQNAIPIMCRQGNDLEDVDGGYSYVRILEGLIRDMMEATASRQSLEDEWEEVNSLSGSGEEVDGSLARGKGKKQRGPATWYEKLAARVVVFGVNYLQGWLALQGFRRAAADRDRNMPKFPLF